MSAQIHRIAFVAHGSGDAPDLLVPFDDDDLHIAAPAQLQRCGQTGGTSPDDQHLLLTFFHGTKGICAPRSSTGRPPRRRPQKRRSTAQEQAVQHFLCDDAAGHGAQRGHQQRVTRREAVSWRMSQRAQLGISLALRQRGGIDVVLAGIAVHVECRPERVGEHRRADSGNDCHTWPYAHLLCRAVKTLHAGLASD